MDVADIYNGGHGKYMQWNTTPAIKKNEILPSAAAWMDLEGIMQSEINQTEKDIYYILSLVYKIWKWKKASEYNKTETDSQIYRTNSRLPLGSGKGEEQDRVRGLKDTNYYV